MSLNRLNVEKIQACFRNSPLPQISTFSLGQKECAYYEKSAYDEWAQYFFLLFNQYFRHFIRLTENNLPDKYRYFLF